MKFSCTLSNLVLICSSLAYEVRLANQLGARLRFVLTPRHGSWLNLVEGFFPMMARSMLRYIRLATKSELKERIRRTR